MTHKEAWERIQAAAKKNWNVEPEMIRDIPFVMVGRNSSHTFHVGFKNDVFITRSFDLTWEEGDDYAQEEFIVRHTLDELSNAYLGHL